MISINKLIREEFDGSKYLYHFTIIDLIRDILKSNKLIAGIPNDVITFPEDYPEELHNKKTVSLTKRSDLESFGEVRFRLDANLLEADYDLKEFSDPSLVSDNEEELVIMEDIQPLSKYIIDITFVYITDDKFAIDNKEIIDEVISDWGDRIDIKVLYDKGFYDG